MNTLHIYTDPSLTGCVVVETGGDFFAVPRIPNGWKYRSRYRLNPALRSARLRSADSSTAEGLGLPFRDVDHGDDDARPQIDERPQVARSGSVLVVKRRNRR